MDVVEISSILDDTKPERFSEDYGSIPSADQELVRHHILNMIRNVDDIFIELGYKNLK
jgi:hypothetical protein